jgi:signal transduction histidine kinase
VRAQDCAREIRVGADAALAFAAGLAFFALLAAAIPIKDDAVLVVLWGALALAAVLSIAWRLGALYGVPLGIALAFAFDSYYIPPTRNFGTENWQNWIVVAMYVGIGVLLGLLAARTQHRGQLSERARGALADEQAALRRVATLVARGVPAAEICESIAREAGQLLPGIDATHIGRYDPDEMVTAVASFSPRGVHVPVGTRAPLDGNSVTARVYRTGRPARLDNYHDAYGGVAAIVKVQGLRSSVGAPVTVDGRLWGVMVASSNKEEALPADTEARIAAFTELAATAIANADARAELAASRTRILAAADDERRRVVRDLHDGAQQRLVHTVVTLRMTREALARGDTDAPVLVDEALEQAETGVRELRELAHGIMPSALTSGGLPAGVEALASRVPIPVDVDVSLPRLDPAIEASGYFVVAEALTNVVKHARARRAAVRATVEDHSLQITIEDDGAGTANPNGHGLTGLADRLASLGGDLGVTSEPARGTTLVATVPLTQE